MGWRLDDIGRRISWLDLKAVIQERLPTSAIARSVDSHPEWQPLDTRILADVYDAVWRSSNVIIQALGSKLEGEVPQYPRPWDELKETAKPPKSASQVRDELAAVRSRRAKTA